MSRRFSIFAWLTALIVLTLSISNMPARPEAAGPTPQNEVEVFTCFDTQGAETCVLRSGRPNPHVINVPQPISEEERVAAQARDKRWMARCRPTFRQDRYGMPRYIYAAPGCEYGQLD